MLVEEEEPTAYNEHGGLQTEGDTPNGTASDTNAEESTIAKAIYRDVRPWLTLVDDLSALTRDIEISIPQIAVMGDQSSGKSSVLEALSGMPFPRGSGLVTRCPIRLSMKQATDGKMWHATAHTTVDKSNVKEATNPESLRNIMADLTEKLAGQSGGFSTDAAIVRLISPHVPDLTVVDLPGIIRTATAGQDSRVISQVNSLIENYLAQERTIILCVIPANQDIATVDILERAQRVDPAGERTIGVLTKPDLVGPGNENEVLAVLHNVRKPLQLGYVMVKNPSQKELTEMGDLTSPAAVAMARNSEAQFFSSHPVFKTCDSKLVGIENLTNRLTQLLVARVQRELVPMKTEVGTALANVRAELKLLSGHGQTQSDAGRQKLLVSVVQEYVRHLNSIVQGEYRDRIIVMNPRLRLYTRALSVFETLKVKVEATSPRFSDENFVQVLANQMDAFRGRELPGFMSSQSFYMFMSQYVEAWRGPARAAASEIRVLTLEAASKLLEVLVVPYPALREAVKGVAAKVLDRVYELALEAVDNLISKEKDPFSINDFLEQHINKIRYDKFQTAVQEAFANIKAKGLDRPAGWAAAKDEVGASLRQWYRTNHGVNSFSNAEDMSAILEAYWLLAAKRFVDNVCMTLDKQIMGEVVRLMQERCYEFVQDRDQLARFFEEDAKVVAKREKLTIRRDRLSKASAAMASVSLHSMGARSVRVTLTAGPYGFGLSLADENGRVVVKGFRTMPKGQVNPGREAGVRLGDVLEQVEGVRLGSFQEAIERLKHCNETVVLTLIRPNAM